MIIIYSMIGYFIGNISPATIVGKWKKQDIRKLGSKNPGASNVTIELGPKYGVLVAAIDILKAWIPVGILHLLGYDDFTLLLVGTSVVIGHIFPLFYKFKGGKGTASFVGMVLGWNLIWGLSLMVIIFTATLLSNYIVIATMLAYFIYLVLVWINLPINIFLLSLIVPVIAVYCHLENFQRIKNGTEKGVNTLWKKKSDLM